MRTLILILSVGLLLSPGLYSQESPGVSLLDRLALLDQLDREEEIRNLSPEVRELMFREVLNVSSIGAALKRAREAKDWEAEVAALTRWAEHEAVRKRRAAAKAAARAAE